MKRFSIIIGIVLIAVLSWYLLRADPLPDLRPATDHHIQSWVKEFELKNAHEFFEADGSFMDLKFADQNLDQIVIFPLIQRIRRETGLEPLAVLTKENSQHAGGMIVELPLERGKFRQLQSIFIAADEAYPGVILRQYGHQWMQFELLDEETANASGMENWDVEEL